MNERNQNPSALAASAPPPVAGLLDDLADRLLALVSVPDTFTPVPGADVQGTGVPCADVQGTDMSCAVYLYPHISVDGDAVGSVLALGLALEKVGVPFYFPLDEAIPPKLAFLPALDRVESIDADALAMAARPVSRPRQLAAVAIDCSGPERLGARRTWYLQAPVQLVLDHHVSDRPAEPGYVIDTTAAAVGELVFELISILGKKTNRNLMDPTLAMLLMVAIMSDTGSFVYSNTTSRTFSIAAQLMQPPLDLRAITYELFDRSSAAKLRLRGQIFSAAQISHQDRIIYAAVDEPMMVRCQASDHDLDGIIADLRNVSGIDAAFLVRCQPDGTLRVNIRSSERFDAAAFARQFGGGGHPRAAGMTLAGMTLADAADVIVQKAGECL